MTQKHQYNLFILCGIAFLFVPSLSGCSIDRRMEKKLQHVFKQSTLNDSSQLGFALKAVDGSRLVYEKNAHKYFTPASNAKLLTFYAALKIIPDSIPALRYVEKGDSLIFWGTGDPSFLHDRLKGSKALKFLAGNSRKLFYSAGRYTGNVYGLGWAWDDYNDFEQAEITELPIMGNVVTATAKTGKLSIAPSLFKDCFLKDSLSAASSFKVTRHFDRNEFRYPGLKIPTDFTAAIPYKTNTTLTLNLLSDTLHREIQLIHEEMPLSAKTLYDLKTDNVLREMILPSDNFIAEQLLLVCANQFRVDLNGDTAIAEIKKRYLSALPDPPRWVDGSGLSRMNLISPADMVVLLELIYKEVGNQTRLFSMLSAGGKTGTLKNAYPHTDQPFVYGKTGTLSNNYNQSGYLITKKGKIMIFSFMNNHFLIPVAGVKAEMARIITYIHDTF